MNHINIYALTKLRVLLNDNIFTTNNINELLNIIKEDTKCDITSIDYLSHKFIICKDNYLESGLLIRQICTSVCKFLNIHKLDIDVSIDSVEREDERIEIRNILNSVLIGNYVHMIMNIMNTSTPEIGTEIIIQL